jgi:Protein of unknown function (DUF2950)
MDTRIPGFPRRPSLATSFALALLLVAVRAPAEGSGAQRHFKHPEEALRALVAAARSNDQATLLAILGPGSEDLISSGDEVQNAAERKRFVVAAAQRTKLEALDDTHTIAQLGTDDWPFPIPLVKDAAGWRFDTAAGKEELLNRRIGRNELATIRACRAYVDAQREYANRDRDGARAYAQKLRSTPGKHDGLYWDDDTAKDGSPLGPLFADASGEGYALGQASDAPQPYHGYLYRILTAQGPHAPGGARSFVKDGRMTGGFALVAWPADYGASGIQTFVVGEQGIVFQKDLGEKTADLAKAMTAYDPDDSWVPVR